MANLDTNIKRPWHGGKSRRKRDDFAKVYGSRQWRKVSELVRYRDPLCVVCLSKGLHVPTTCADHIVTLRDGGAAFDMRNLRGSCARCNANNRSGSG